MILTTMHRTFAKASADFGLTLFARQDFRFLVEEALDQSDGWEKRECALTAPFVVLFVVAMTFFRTVSQKNLLKQFMMWLRAARKSRLSLRTVTAEAVCHARNRLGIAPMKLLFEKQASRILAKASFHSLCVWAVDGVHLTVPDTEANVAEFGKPGTGRGEAAFPQMVAVALVETVSRLIRAVVIGPTNASEREGLLAELCCLGDRDLVLMDRGFSGAWLFRKMLGSKAHFLARIAKSWKPEMLMRLGPGDWLVRIRGEAPRQKGQKAEKIALVLRMLEYEILGERSRLITDLVDPDVYTARELAIFYHRRWEVELSFDEIKTHLASTTQGTLATILRSKTPNGAIQEAYGMFIAYNLVRTLILEAGEAHGVPALEISFVDALHVIRLTWPELERARPADRLVLLSRLLADIAACRIDRPRRGRRCARARKVKMSKWRLKRPKDRSEKIDYEAGFRLAG